MREAGRFPVVVKTSVSTASRGIWFVRHEDDLEQALRDLESGNAFADEVLVQELIAGTTEKAQSVFCRGRMIGFHAYRQVAAGVGGGEAIKQSVGRPQVQSYLEKIGQALDWHGALSVDYIMPIDDTTPLLIDCNPRPVEPFNAYRSGNDLVGLFASAVARRNACAVTGKPRGRAHASGDAGAARLRLARRNAGRSDQGMRAAVGGAAELTQESTEELTPVGVDWLSAVPLAMTAGLLLAAPTSANKLARGGFGAHLLDVESIRVIEEFADRVGWAKRKRDHHLSPSSS